MEIMKTPCTFINRQQEFSRGRDDIRSKLDKFNSPENRWALIHIMEIYQLDNAFKSSTLDFVF